MQKIKRRSETEHCLFNFFRKFYKTYFYSEKQLNEALIRKCPRCAVQFVKETGCNKMTCRCGMTQCYLCRESGIGYDHFCQ